MADEPKWLQFARKEIGTKEIVGPKHNPKVVSYFAEAGFPEVKDDETAWCSGFANAMLARAGVKGSGSLAARSFMKWGVEVLDPQPGDIAVFARGNSTWQGHVAFFLEDCGDKIKILGGNQNNAVSIMSYPASALLGYRRPGKKKTMAKSKTGNGAIATGVGGAAIAVETAKQVQETASGVMELIKTPNFIIAVVIICVAAAIWYWRWRKIDE